MFAFSDDHLKRYEFFCFSGSGLPSGEEQYFSQFGDRHASVFMQSKAQFFYVFHRGAAGTMKCCKVCLIFAVHDHAVHDHAVHAHNKHWIPHGMVQVALGARCYLDTNLSPKLSTRINSDGETERWHHRAGLR